MAEVMVESPFHGQIYPDGTFDGVIDIALPDYFTPKVTALHSVNAFLAENGADVYYLPTLSDFPLDISKVATKVTDTSGREHKFAVVYDGWFDTEVMSKVAKDGDNTIYKVSPNIRKERHLRALEVLGYDFLLRDEKVNLYVKGNTLYADYKPVLVTDDNIDAYTAAMNIYKALGQYEYDIRIGYTKDDTLSVETSPIQQYINVLLNRETNLDTSDGKSWVWLSRTNRDFYLEKAQEDFKSMGSSGIADILENSSADKVTDADTDSNLNQPITLGEFCKYVKELMILYGEPVMSEQEEAMLIQVYGKNLPYYMASDTSLTDGSEILDSIKYLVAKGILNPDRETAYDFASNLTVDDMLEILMAVKDKDSRYTFKDVQISLDTELQSLGYFETTLTGALSPIVDITTSTAAAAEYYDYYIQSVDGMTNFMKDGAIVTDKFCLYTTKGKRTLSNENGVFYYVGTVDGGYYHFKIKAGNSYLKNYLTKDGYLKIGTIVSGTSPSYYRVKAGGGVYGSKGKYANTRLKLLDRKSFDNEFGDNTQESLVDSVRKRNAQKEESETQLSPVSSIPIRFYLSEDTWKSDLPKLKWKANVADKDGTPLTALVSSESAKFDKYTITRDKNAKNGLVFFTVTGCQDLSEFRSHLMHDNNSGRYNEYQTYCQDGNNVLVNFDYLQDVGIAKRYIELSDNIVLLTTPHNNIYLCPKQKWIVVGNTIYDMPSGSLMYYKKDGKMFIDYRAALGWAGDYYLFQEKDGRITLSLAANKIGKSTASKLVTTPMGANNTSSLGIQTYDNKILLTSTYPLANYLIYDGSDEASTSSGETDYLFVFKLKDVKYANDKKVSDLYKNDKKAREKLTELVGVKAPNNWLVYIYQLHKDSNKQKANPPGIQYSKRYGYLYEPLKYTANWKEHYFASCLVGKNNAIKGTEKEYSSSSDIVLPFLNNNGKIYDVNFNTFKIKNSNIMYGGAPEYYMSSTAKYTSTLVSYWKPGVGNNTLGSTNVGTAEQAEITPAPTGVLYAIMNLGTMTASELSQTSNKIYVGTMEATVQQPSAVDLQYSAGTAKPKLKLKALIYGEMGGEGLDKFNILRSTSLGYVLGLPSDKTLTADDAGRTGSAEKPNIGQGLSLAGFDWEQFKFKNLLENADDFITIATIALLNILPRIAIFIFLGLIGLSLITNVKIWILFCDKIFDVYKFFTFNRKDVHTIDTFTMFWTSILALAAFGLFMDGTIINVIAWFVRAGTAILTR